MQRTIIDTSSGRRAALLWDRAGPDAPWLHFAHATGMNAGLYARLLAPLADRFRIIASDARGHGATAKLTPGDPDGDRVEWEVFAGDTLAIIDAVDSGARWLLAGHSLGGSTSLLAAAARPDRVAGLVLLDPPFIPFVIARAALAAGAVTPNPMADKAGRRRAGYPDSATARAAWAGRGVFASFSDDDMDAYLGDALRETADGVTLACSPGWEAATFRGVSHRIEAALTGVQCPFALLAGEIGSTVPAAEFAIIAAHPRCVSAQRLAGSTHFLPLERGDAVRAVVASVADAA
ncbi:MAG: alpha/beta fold hydrolase [Polymorphobacter sp.]